MASYQVLARRLRPQRFEDIVGQEHVTRTLRAALRAGRIAHAFLFTGPRGVGKTTTARILARALNCERGPTPEPCGTCANCREIAEGTAFDVLEIDGASHTQVDKMRDLMETVAHRPLKSRFKVFIIDEVHMLSSHSFNALLKTLEEPPAHVKFIFATTDPHKVLPTVLSRCQRYDLRRIGLREIASHLERVCAAEGATLSAESLTLIAREAEGSLRDAQSLLEQVLVAAEGAVSDEAVRALLGAADRRLVVEVADAILAGDPAACLHALGRLYLAGYDAQRFCRDLLEHFRHLAVLAVTGDVTLLEGLPDGEIATLTAQAARRPADDLQRLFQLLLDTEATLGQPVRTVEPQLVLEMRLLRLATLPALLPVDEIMDRLERLATGAGGEAVDRVPPAATVSSRPPAVPASRQVPDGGAGSHADDSFWEAFLARVQRERLALFMTLAAGRFLGLADDVVRVGIGSEAVRKDVGSRDNLAFLEATASEVAGRPVRLVIAPVPPDGGGAKAAGGEPPEAMTDPLVRAAVEIFGAEVRGVRDRRS